VSDERNPGSTGIGSSRALEGRLRDPGLTLGTDPRTDPRIVAAFAAFGLENASPAPPVTSGSPREDLLDFCLASEAGFQAVFEAWATGLAQVQGISSETRVIRGADDNAIGLHVHRPAEIRGPLPCVVHLHGGGMVFLSAEDPCFVRWREEVAATGLVVVGVEFRNGAGRLGPHPFPAGLGDCAAAARWAFGHRDELGISNLVISGESGGGNLALALSLKANREGWVDEISGVYAQCPYISGQYASPPAELPSLLANDDYFIGCRLFSVLAEVYDPGGEHSDDPTCWPLQASDAELEGLPPHVISVNELDPLRDEGLAYYRRLRNAGVRTVGRMVAGTSHGADVLLASAIPEVRAASLRDLSGFARSLA
jgi:acetyl esterase/lipase